jgi:hypothetical protein
VAQLDEADAAYAEAFAEDYATRLHIFSSSASSSHLAT